MKKIILLVIGVLLMALVSCNNVTDSKDEYSKCDIYPVDFGERAVLGTKDEITAYLKPLALDNQNCENGIVNSPYFTMTINGMEIPVYATRSASTNGVHSFAYIDIVKEDSTLPVELNVEIKGTSLKKAFAKVDVLPESNGVTATHEGKTTNATITKAGNYSFVFGGKEEQALTLMVTERIDTETLFGDKEVVYYEPGTYTLDNNIKVAENTVCYLKKGDYEIGQITLSDDSILYFESGAYLKLYPDGKNPIYSANKTNVTVCGHGLLDFSYCDGSSLEGRAANNSGKGGLSFNTSTNVNLNGFMLINAQTWQCCLTDSKVIDIRNLMFFGYRTYADGIMLSDCKDALVEYNFIRTGDDAFETKSTSANGYTERVVFQYNSAWTDKAVAYGCIYESNHDTDGVKFLNNSVGFANGTWSRHLGCAVVQMGNRKEATMKNIVFDGMEIYYCKNQALCNIYIGGSGGQGAGYGYVKNITFKNITCKSNVGTGLVLNLQTYDSENCKIYKVTCENIISNGTLLTKDNIDELVDYEMVKGGYDLSNLYINGERCS